MLLPQGVAGMLTKLKAKKKSLDGKVSKTSDEQDQIIFYQSAIYAFEVIII